MEELTWLELFILGLASFRLTRLVVSDLIMEWFRSPFIDIKIELNEEGEEEEWEVPNSFIGEGLSCQWCVGIWSATILYFIYTFLPYGTILTLILAIAGLQSLIYGWSDRYL